MRTIAERASRACLPWNSVDAGKAVKFESLPQQKIDICLMCPLHAGSCDHCDGHRTVKKDRGRPRAEVDTELLREMMKLKRPNTEICAALGIGKTKLAEEKRKILEEDSK